MKAYVPHSVVRITGEALRQSLHCAAEFVSSRVGKERGWSRETRSLRGSKRGLSVMVLGNGPSLRILDPEKVRLLQAGGFDVIATNAYMVNPMSRAVIPDYYVISDPDWVQAPKEKGAQPFEEEIAESNKRLSRAGIPIFMPINLAAENPYPNKVFYFNDCELFFSRYDNNILRPRAFPSLTGMKAIWVADFLGYSSIYIAGIDANGFQAITVDIENRLKVVQRHAHESGRPAPIVIESPRSVAYTLYAHHNVFASFHKFPVGKITNLDPAGLVDAFEKKHTLDIYV